MFKHETLASQTIEDWGDGRFGTQKAHAVGARVLIDGAQAQLTRIEVDERVGDRTVLVVQPSLSNQSGSK